MRYWIDHHGCAKNQVDAEVIASILGHGGHELVELPELAEVLIVNSCGFIESAKAESINAVISLRAAYPAAKILLAGCLAQRYGSELAQDLSEADAVAGNLDVALAAEAALAIYGGQSDKRLFEGHARADFTMPERTVLFDYPGTAHVKVTEGCSNNCSFCAIPLIRGAQKSRTIDEIVAECAQLVGQGRREIVLIGQDLGRYGRDLGAAHSHGKTAAPDLVMLVRHLLEIHEDFRLRIMYIHPDHFPQLLVPVMAADTRVLPYFDLPVQHSQREILRAMNRQGRASDYLDLVRHIRDSLPESAIRSTFLLGFPGETDADFEALLQFQDTVRFDWLGCFAWSEEEGTAACALEGRVPSELAHERIARIEEAQVKITRAVLETFVGREVDVLVEERVDNDETWTIGRCWNQAPEVDGLTLLKGAFTPGEIVRARIVKVNGVDFEAIAVGAQAQAAAKETKGGR